jgi:heme/copper-type cytochrome/quinol oxidase subunit 4
MAGDEIKKQSEDTASTGGESGIAKPEAEVQSTERAGIDSQLKIQEMDRDIRLSKVAWDNNAKEIEKVKKELKKHNDNLKNLDTKISNYEDRVRNTELRSIEVIGIISSIIALVLAFIDTANAQRSLKDSFSILIVGTASLILFAVLLHNFFNKEDKKHWIYYTFAIGLPIVIILAIGFLIFFK